MHPLNGPAQIGWHQLLDIPRSLQAQKLCFWTLVLEPGWIHFFVKFSCACHRPLHTLPKQWILAPPLFFSDLSPLFEWPQPTSTSITLWGCGRGQLFVCSDTSYWIRFLDKHVLVFLSCESTVQFWIQGEGCLFLSFVGMHAATIRIIHESNTETGNKAWRTDWLTDWLTDCDSSCMHS